MASALVVGLGLNGLGVVRSLARAGIRCHAFDDNLASAYCRTNACTKSSAPLAGEGLVAALAAYRAGLDHDPVLFLTREDGVATVSAARPRVSGYRIAMPDADVVAAMVNKDRFMAVAEASGLLVPQTVTLRSHGDLGRLTTLSPPFIVKPSEHSDAYSGRFKKAYVFQNLTEAAETVRGMVDVAGEVVGQEYIPGDDGSVFFCLGYFGEAGEMLAGYTGYKTASWPPRVGGTAGCAPAMQHHGELAELTTRFFRAAGFRGMGSLEFKRHADTGKFYLIEPTACRTDYQSEIATLNGINLPAAQFAEQVGESFAAGTARSSYGWRDPTAVASGANVPKSGQGWKAVDALWRAGDPGPWLAFQWRRASSKLRLSGRR